MVFMHRRPARNILNMLNDLDEFMANRYQDLTQDDLSELTIHGNLEETKNDYIVTLEIPGIEKKDVKITFHNGDLVISGEKRAEKSKDDGTFHHYERQYGKFSRVFTLPMTVVEDKISADYKNGVLTVTLPKAEDVKAKEIKIDVK